MTRTDKIIRVAQILEPGAISATVKRLLLKAESILDVAYTTEDDDTAIATYHAQPNSGPVPEDDISKPIQPSFKPPFSSRSETIKSKKDWGERRVATKPKQDRIDLVSLLKGYVLQRAMSPYQVGQLAKRQGVDISRDDVGHWLAGRHLPSDYKFDQLMKFLVANDKAKAAQG